MKKRVAIVQSSYIPWKGYFDLIHSVDEFILLDCVQYTRRDWRNRNRIRTPHGTAWLSIPIEVRGKYHQAIKDTVVADAGWGKHHWATIRQNYRKAPFFPMYRDRFEALYLSTPEKYLSRINFHFLTAVCEVLNITTKLSWSSDYRPEAGKNERLVSLCAQAGASEYLSGPAAAVYLDESAFQSHGIDVKFFDYGGYPEYPQVHRPFEPFVTVLDLLFNVGPAAGSFLKTFRKESLPPENRAI